MSHETLDTRTWLPAAQGLGVGGRARIDHDCGPGKTLLVEHTAAGWRGYCFRCDAGGFVPAPSESVFARIARIKRERSADSKLREPGGATPPSPANREVDTWPIHARNWLYKAGLGKPEIMALGAYVHPPTGRVVLPISEHGTIVYWQARDPLWTRGSTRPKYVNPCVDKSALVARYGSGTPLVLTEDILSAFRVGQVTQAWSLLGTNLTDPVLAQVIRHGGPIRVWLDGDLPGVTHSKAILKQLLLCGLPAARIETPQDPKSYGRAEIAEIIRRSMSDA